jgi:Arc/MetJ-type ribon-helix-helix transcriptional regulator
VDKNTSVSLGYPFEEFVKTTIGEARPSNDNEVIRTGLKLPEKENKNFMFYERLSGIE